MTTVLRTPDTRFHDLPGYPFAANYCDDLTGYAGLRMHYLDEGTKNARVALCLHGQPTWSYLYRKMIPGLVSSGYRVIAPDMFGFGRSDKPVDDAVYSFDFHRDSLVALIRALDLRRVTLVCQDWGGLLGLTIPPDMPDRFEGLLIMNTMFATGDRPLTKGFLDWRAWNNANPDMAVGKLLSRACPQLSSAEADAYDAPFPDATYKAGVRRFPNLVPDHPDAGGAAMSCRAREWWGTEWSGRTAMVIGMSDPVLGPAVMADMRRTIRNCPEPVELAVAGHFVQEWGDDVLRGALPQLS
ncbi:haloalkane dehalogenase [Bradyrhizobium sp. NAS80.1]|uniref:haloalkane dehalogenase n=1 Tax=Bradyrhizobium sp. NAS80.1 TaxID=1680159 RepID=UPI00095CD88F|nr:haloalkane dehalogenase [Bradyrhizobium sp. NAS80.1]OKO75623.1 haloalkane dehalogenase [Bradyrhizobium sp. NAS80.1]